MLIVRSEKLAVVYLIIPDTCESTRRSSLSLKRVRGCARAGGKDDEDTEEKEGTMISVKDDKKDEKEETHGVYGGFRSVILNRPSDIARPTHRLAAVPYVWRQVSEQYS